MEFGHHIFDTLSNTIHEYSWQYIKCISYIYIESLLDTYSYVKN